MAAYTELNLTRGLVVSQNPAGLPLGCLTDGRNVVWVRGRLVKRPGFTVISGQAASLPVWTWSTGGLQSPPTASLPLWTWSQPAAARARFAYFFRDATDTPHLVACSASSIFNFRDDLNQTFETRGALHNTADNSYYDAEAWGGTLYLVKDGDFWAWDGIATGPFRDLTLSVTAPTPGNTAPAYPVSFRYLRAFGSCLIGAYPTIAGTTFDQAIYWSNTLLPEDFATCPPAGNNTRRTLRGAITGLETVGRGLALFSEESIEMIGEGPDAITMPFTFEPAEPTVGTYSPHSIQKLGPPFSGMLVFLGSDKNIHIFNGYRAEPVATAIHPWLRENLEESNLAKAWGRVWPELGVYRLAVPTSGAVENNLVIDWWYNLPSPIDAGLGQFYLHQFAGSDGAWSAATRWVKAAPATWVQRRAAGLSWAQRRAIGTRWSADRTTSGRREVAFLGATGTMVAPFEGVNDGASAVSAYAQFAPVDLSAVASGYGGQGGGQLSQVEAVEVLDDRLGGTLVAVLGWSRDGTQWTTQQQTHVLSPTDWPYVQWKSGGRYFLLRITSGDIDGSMNLRGVRLLDAVPQR